MRGAIAPLGPAATRRSRTSRTRSSGRTSSRSAPPSCGPGGVQRARGRCSQTSSASTRGRLLERERRADLREDGRPQRRDRDHRLAAADHGLHRVPVRAEVRDPGADRAVPRPADHGGRLLADRPGGDDVDGRGAADDPRVLALRHRDRVRPHPRERAAHAARGVLADRQPLDERGADPIAGDARSAR